MASAPVLIGKNFMLTPVPPVPVPVHVVCAIIQRGELILLAQRPEGKRLAGLWEFPGGKVDDGEETAAALHREIMEELGCQIADLQPGPPVCHAYPWGEICLHPFLCRLTEESGLPHAHEHTALAWVPAANLGNFELAPADIPVVEWLQTALAGD
jgi:8-oxo-dGTP diphosphatase